MRPPIKGLHNSPLIKNKYRISLLKSRGVPEGILYSSFPKHFESAVTRLENDPEKKIHIEVSRAKQMGHLEKTINDPFGNNYLFCIAGETSDALPLQIALQIFDIALANNTGSRRPYWHVVLGGTKDALRDASELTEMTMGGAPSLLVISNLAINSTAMKIEKVRDLLNTYSNIPRILVIAGDNPISYCSKILFTSVNRVLYFSNNKG